MYISLALSDCPIERSTPLDLRYLPDGPTPKLILQHIQLQRALISEVERLLEKEKQNLESYRILLKDTVASQEELEKQIQSEIADVAPSTAE